jgi:hypothetical protein
LPVEQKAWAPLWLEYSGLPELVGDKVRGGAGWLVFRKIVELDCAANAHPAPVEVSVEELCRRTGTPAVVIHKALAALRKLKLIACFIPEDDEEPGLFRVSVPLRTPVSRADLRAAHPTLFADPQHYFRYLDEATGDLSPDDAPDPALQEVVDLYFNTVGLKMNAFILDELRLIRHRFPLEQVKKVFRRAQQNEIRSLSWVVRELVRARKKKHDEEIGENN